ncbi:hypothetical protein HAX54_042410 [Datura stramonium]|uniref:Bromo domain-containing protein n=1 Tax=Datura stramonium TaxID=4076 RepID=A0ABS8VZ71_DATST|nr:hypothetical protein [Datura stramonium]
MKKEQSEGPPSCTRASIKRKFHQVGDNCNSVSTKHAAVAEDAHHKKNSSKCNSKPTKLPEKRILELILDVLQRRDTHEIFAEPVDPTEVEDYYEIIREPMDFGTMRAKLHEGMYQNLEQFEHDAFLIPKNAMHFNSSGTVYFRQARAIYELAKKVFHVLKTNPGNFEVEFPVTRRRSMRRLQNDVKDTRHSQGVVPDGATDDSSKNIGLGPSVPSTYRRSSKEPSLSTKGAAPIDSAFLLGNRHSQWLSSLDAGPRSPYEFSCRPSLYHETSSFMCNKSLILVSSSLQPASFDAQFIWRNREASYRESLISFSKDLGPVAQMVANRKSLNNGVQPPTCLGFAAFAAVKSQSNTGVLTSSQKLSSPVGGFGSVLSDKMDLTNAAKGDETCKIANSPLSRTENSEKSTSILCYRRNVHKVTEEAAKKTQNGSESRENNLHSHISTNETSGDRKKLGRTSAKLEENKVLPVILALEQSHSSLSELKCRNKKSSNSISRTTRSQRKIAESNVTRTIPDQTPKNKKHQNKAAICDQDNNFGCSGNRSILGPMGKPLELKLDNAIPVIPFPARASSRFIFDMPFLKAQLNQMNPVGKNDMSQVSKDNLKRSLYGQGSYQKMVREVNPSVSLRDKPNSSLQTTPAFIYNNQSSYSSLDTDLALQL